MFNDAAQAVFKNKCHNLIHQYNVPKHPGYYAYNTIELLALLGLKEAQDNPCEKLYDRKYAPVKFFGFRCDPADLDKARNKLVSIINDMAASKWIIASLYNLGTLELVSDPLTPGTRKICIFSYLAVDLDHEDDVKAVYSFAEFKEGGVPPELT